jgi:hypothetical protein
MQGTGLASAAVLAPSWRRDMTEEVPANTICAVTAEAARNVRFDHGGRLPTRLNQPGAPKRTAIYSGLLRMADLLALQPRIQISLHIVAPASRR